MVINSFDGIVTVSGDGLIHEVINGLLGRDDNYYETRKIPIGALPGGSSNGFVKTVTHESKESSDVEQACLLIIKGQTKCIDIIKYTLAGREKPIYSFLCFFWAILSDIDLESEKIRCIGSYRFFWWTILRIFKLRRYSGVLEYNGEDFLTKNQKVRKIEE